MIDLNFGLFWSGSPMSYLRYLTFKTLRFFHPHSRIQLFYSTKFSKSKISGADQEYLNPQRIKTDYLPLLKDLNVEMVEFNKYPDLSPNHQSDLMRWYFLNNFGGFYLDTDQIVLKSFKTLPIMSEFIYSSYKVKSHLAFDGSFSPVGVLGSVKGSKIVNHIINGMMKYYDSNDYNCIGPVMFMNMIKKIDMGKAFNAPSNYFYPAEIGDKLDPYFSGKASFNQSNFCMHWYGGYKPSQVFNSKYTEAFAQKSNDSISVFLRKKKII